MSFRSWKAWFFSLPLWMKWFVVLMLIRPVVDQFWYVKEIGLLSPSEIIGAIFPVLVFVSVFGKKISKKYIPVSLVILLLLILFNHTILIGNAPTVNRFGELIKHSTFIFIFFYILLFIRNQNDFYFLLQTFLISSIIPMGILVYELFMGPINASYLAPSRGGGIRYNGGFADVVSYAIYFIGSFIIVNYFYIKSHFEDKKYISTTVYVLFSVFTIITLILIKHTASWAVFVAIIILALRKYLKTLKGFMFVVFPLILMIVFGGEYIYSQQIEPLINKEINVIEGESELDNSFNGRMSRWIYYFGVWNNMPLRAQLFGSPLSGQQVASVMISGNIHNDYIRLLFLSGIIGVFFYLIFLLNTFLNIKYLSKPDQFLILSSIGMIALYSVSAHPTIYPVLQYFFMAIVVHSLKMARTVRINN